VFGGALAVVGAFCYAELATTYPRSGGDYVYLTRAFGPWCGFLFGWAQLAVLLPAAIGGMAVVFAEFATATYRLADYTGLGLSSEFSYAVLAVVVLSSLNILGVTLGKSAQNLLTLAKVIGIAGSWSLASVGRNPTRSTGGSPKQSSPFRRHGGFPMPPPLPGVAGVDSRAVRLRWLERRRLRCGGSAQSAPEHPAGTAAGRWHDYDYLPAHQHRLPYRTWL